MVGGVVCAFHDRYATREQYLSRARERERDQSGDAIRWLLPLALL